MTVRHRAKGVKGSEADRMPDNTGIALKWLRRAGYIALGVAGSLTVAVGAASFPLSGLLIRPRLKRLAQLNSPHIKDLFKRLRIQLEEISITSFDGTCLPGWWLPVSEGSPTIVVLHGVKKNRTDVVRAALVLRRAGFNVLMFDGRGHGNGERKFVTYGFYERRDVESAIDWLVREKRVQKENIGLAGESMGAAIALQVAAHNPWIRAVWADSPFASLERITSEFVERVTHLPRTVLHPVLWTTIQVANYRGKFDVRTIDPLALAREIKCAVYLVHGTADQLIAVEHSSNIYDALGGKKELWLVDGARHARSARYAKQEYSKRLIKFFSEQLSLPLRIGFRRDRERLGRVS
jgi:dipeptidyl aminopeptidase/acylaminoacyl peptidase